MNTRELIRAYEEEGLPLVCHWCGREFDDAHPPTKDHITPKAEKGGKNRGNLVLACEPCNSARGTAYQHEIEQQRSYMRFFILTKLAAQPNSRALDIHHDIARERRWNASFSSLVKEKLIEKTVHGYYDQPPLWAVTDAGRAYLKPKPKPPQAKPTSPNWRANKSRSLRRKAAKKRAAMGLDASRPCV